MILNKKNILKIKYNNDPDYFLGAGCATCYKDEFLKVMINNFDFFNKFGNKSLTKEEITKKFKIKDRGASVMLSIFIKQRLLDIKNKKYFLTNLAKEWLWDKSHE
jgi:hypothetical protein